MALRTRARALYRYPIQQQVILGCLGVTDVLDSLIREANGADRATVAKECGEILPTPPQPEPLLRTTNGGRGRNRPFRVALQLRLRSLVIVVGAGRR